MPPKREPQLKWEGVILRKVCLKIGGGQFLDTPAYMVPRPIPSLLDEKLSRFAIRYRGEECGLSRIIEFLPPYGSV